MDTSWTMQAKLDCPSDKGHGVIEGITFAVDFIFVGAERHRTNSTWRLGCGCEIPDALVDWDANEDDNGVMWAALLDVSTGAPVLVWSDGTSDHIDDEDDDEY